MEKMTLSLSLSLFLSLIDSVHDQALTLERRPAQALGVGAENNQGAQDQACLDAHEPHLVLQEHAAAGRKLINNLSDY
jgi:hypothetical protein